VLEDGTRTRSETGTPQGGSASPLPANVYLHYVFDLWVQQWRRRDARGDMIVVRYADDFIVGFQQQSDAERFRADLTERFRKFKLELHPDKTRLLESGPFAAENRRRGGRGKPETFSFLGFTHLCGKQRSNGRFTVLRQTMRKRLQAKLSEVKAELRHRWHDPIPAVGQGLQSVVRGHLRYYGVAMNHRSLRVFRFRAGWLWHRALGQTYVAEVPCDFTGWVCAPRLLLRPTTGELRQPRKHRRFPRLAVTATGPSEVRQLREHSQVFTGQRWQRFHIKDSEKGPIVWEIKHADFFRKHPDGLPGPTHTLIIARNALDHEEVKYFVANVAAGADLEKLKGLLHVAFSRFPIEHTFRQAKDELGMDPFEVRGWRSIHRHLYVTRLSRLFSSRIRRGLREKNRGARRVDGRAGLRRGLDLGGGPGLAPSVSLDPVSTEIEVDRLPPGTQSPGPGGPSKENARVTDEPRPQHRRFTLVHAG
jgi:RNA-directed DNA polymerase